MHQSTARLAGIAEAGQLLVSAKAAEAAGASVEEASARTVDVRGRSEGLKVYSLEVGGAGSRR